MNRLLTHLLIPILVFIIPFTVYLSTLSPGVAPGDSTEMVTAAIVLGVPHQPSYPVNTILGHLASKLEWLHRSRMEDGRFVFVPMNVVERVNSVAAFLQALTVLVFYFLVEALFRLHLRGENDSHLGGGERLAAFTASMFLAFSLVFWQYATKFEVFPLNNFLAVLLLLTAVKIARRGTDGKAQLREKADRNTVMRTELRRDGLLFPALGFLAGFAFTHHQTIIFLFPAILFLLWRQGSSLSRQGSSLSIGSFILGMMPFVVLLLWIAAQNPPLNWGEVRDLDGVVAALTRRDFGTFSSFLVGSEPQARQAPIAQIPFYVKSLVLDFSLVGAALAVVGTVFLWRKQRQLFWFVTLGIGMSGFGFLMYANFPLFDSFNQATVRRFHLLPNLLVALSIAFGIFSLYRKLALTGLKKIEQRMGIFFGKGYLLLAFLFPLVMNFAKADNSRNILTTSYARDAYAMTPENALIMLSGDIPNMTVDYYRDVELGGADQRITFTPGQFHLPWFTPQLLRKHPDLVIPDPLAGKRFTTATQIIDANWGKRPIFVGPDLVVHDPELEERFVLYPKHLLFLVKQKGEDLKLEELRAENEALWGGMDLELIKNVRRRSQMYEETVVFHYARHFFNTGFVYEEVGLNEDAIREYKRVLEIDPFFKEALAALARVYGEKLTEPDYLQAIDYWRKYQSVLKKGEEEYGYAAEGKIYEYQEKAAKELEKETEADAEKKREATESGEAAETTIQE